MSDEETVLQIQENPYLQYFVGLCSYKDEPLFTARLLVEIRKRMGKNVFSSFEKSILSSIESKRIRKTTQSSETSEMVLLRFFWALLTGALKTHNRMY